MGSPSIAELVASVAGEFGKLGFRRDSLGRLEPDLPVALRVESSHSRIRTI